MRTNKQKHPQKIESLTNLFAGTSKRLFGGNNSLGFVFWGAGLHLEQAESQPTEEDLLECITDGAGDLGIDAYYIDEDGRTIYLFQGKYSKATGTIKRDEVASLMQSPRSITNPQALFQTHNSQILELAPIFREKILDGYELNLIFLSTQRATNPILTQAEDWNKAPLFLWVKGEEVEVQHRMHISDVYDLLQLSDAATDLSTFELDLHLIKERWHTAPTTNSVNCLVATIEAQELVDIFDRHQFRVFRDNPRGPLGGRGKVNKAIAETLQSEVERPLFHLLNNGLSGVCASFTDPIPSNGGFLTHVTDLQIVNGCQTTYTLWDQARRNIDLTDVFVTLKLVETPLLQRAISKTSNSQSQMTDWDFLFNDSIQMRLQKEFEQLSPPVFYELKRGEYRYMQSSNAQRVTIKDIAQAAWAFMGSPGEAKDKVRFVPRSKDTKSGAYHEVFYDNVSAQHLWICRLAYEKVYQEHRNYAANTGIKGNFREHGRLYVLWLIGRAIRKLTGFEAHRDISITKVADLTTSIDEWFPELHRIAVSSIQEVTRIEEKAAEKADKPFSLRQLFRSSSMYQEFEETHDEQLQRSDRLPSLV